MIKKYFKLIFFAFIIGFSTFNMKIKTQTSKDDQFYMFPENDENDELNKIVHSRLYSAFKKFYNKINNNKFESSKKDNNIEKSKNEILEENRLLAQNRRQNEINEGTLDRHNSLASQSSVYPTGQVSISDNVNKNDEKFSNNFITKNLKKVINWINDDSDWKRVDKEWNDYNKYNKEDYLIKDLDSQKNRCSGEVRQKLKNNSPHTTNEDLLGFGQSQVGIDNEPKTIEDFSDNQKLKNNSPHTTNEDRLGFAQSLVGIDNEPKTIENSSNKNPCILNVSDTSGSKDKKVANNIIANGIDNGLTIIGAAATIYASYYIYKNYIKEKINNYRSNKCSKIIYNEFDNRLS